MVFHWIYSHWCYYDYRLRSLSKIAWYLYSFAMVLLIGLELQVPGAVTIKGATAWYRLPGIGNFQPSEIMKLFLIIVIGRIIANHNEKYFPKRYMMIFTTWKIFATSLPPLLLIAKEPDLGNTMVISAMLAAMILVSGIRWRFIFGLVSGTFVAGSTLIYIFYSHRFL